MGRDESHSCQELLSAQQVACLLKKNCPSLRHFEAYMFGSSLRGLGEDYDLLIIGSRGERLLELKKEITVLKKQLPLDVLYMTPHEAKETNFVKLQGCVELCHLL